MYVNIFEEILPIKKSIESTYQTLLYLSVKKPQILYVSEFLKTLKKEIKGFKTIKS